MSIVSKICITPISGKKMIEINSVEVIANKGILNDRYFNDENEKDIQLTLIESENIDYFNKKSKTKIADIDFRRNIITKGINLNNLIGKEILIGEVRIKGQRLCDPCKYLQEKLQENNTFKNMTYLYKRGGLRCEILTSGKISNDDKIEVVN